jgi:hypothetical protein
MKNLLKAYLILSATLYAVSGPLKAMEGMDEKGKGVSARKLDAPRTNILTLSGCNSYTGESSIPPGILSAPGTQLLTFPRDSYVGLSTLNSGTLTIAGPDLVQPSTYCGILRGTLVNQADAGSATAPQAAQAPVTDPLIAKKLKIGREVVYFSDHYQLVVKSATSAQAVQDCVTNTHLVKKLNPSELTGWKFDRSSGLWSYQTVKVLVGFNPLKQSPEADDDRAKSAQANVKSATSAQVVQAPVTDPSFVKGFNPLGPYDGRYHYLSNLYSSNDGVFKESATLALTPKVQPPVADSQSVTHAASAAAAVPPVPSGGSASQPAKGEKVTPKAADNLKAIRELESARITTPFSLPTLDDLYDAEDEGSSEEQEALATEQRREMTSIKSWMVIAAEDAAAEAWDAKAQRKAKKESVD